MKEKSKLFEIINDFFDQVYVINMERSKKRRDIIEERLQGLNFQFHRAVDGKELHLDQLEAEGLYHSKICKLLKKRRSVPAVDMPVERIACALSHRSVIEKAIAEKHDRILVLEDDVTVFMDGADALAKALSELPIDWDLLYLGHFGANSNPTRLLKFQSFLLSNFAKIVQPFERMRIIDAEVIEGWFPRKYSTNLDHSGNQFGTHAYGLSSSGLKKLYGYLTPVVQEVDNMCGELCNYGWLNAFNTRQKIFYQDGEIPSTIDD